GVAICRSSCIMSLLLRARVEETSTTTGTGSLSLDGAVSGFRTFVSAFGTGGKCYYTIIDGTAWEMGQGTITSGTPDVLSRDIILESSAGGSVLTLSAGIKTVYCAAPAVGYFDPEDRVLRSRLTFTGVQQTGSGVAYFVYVGKTSRPLTVAFVECYMTTSGTGAQTAEVGLFSTPLAPNKSGQTLTKLIATGTVDSLTAAANMRRNTTTFALAVPAGTFLWAAIRTAMASTQPTFAGVAYDLLEGYILTTSGQGALTSLTTTAGALFGLST